MKKINFTPGELVLRSNIKDSEYGIVIEEVSLDTWARAKDAMELHDFSNMKDSAVWVIWFWCTDQFSAYTKGRGGGRLHKSWELASRLTRAYDEQDEG
jgi:hypothetical protein